ncbi:glyoxal oxidase N-terminus-domain-containing protein [Dactylonectria macrodidyma]|uniref:Glyoxal oxidase N-terminus-domain-containing protein n=1 Tax=Dactylonectria macrodidyma TaxID=307937 RepID=A0A9P9FNQ8_9HYPO|nr:glyoxal oxidase N-terminus-domain-containing protein [Dactylonectria macrodidyma]
MAALRLVALGAAFLHLTSASVILRRDLTPPQEPQDGWEYVGCFVDTVASRALNGAVHYDTEGLTAETCVEYCDNAGFTYAGLEYGVECWCGNKVPTTLVDDSDCSMACSGDDEQPCGAGNRLSISSSVASSSGTPTASVDSSTTASATDDVSSTTSVPTVTGLPDGWEYKGCYIDPPGRAMEPAPGSPSSSNTPESCIAKCIANGFKIAGMEYSEECYCGNALNNAAKKTTESDCNMPCSGDSSQMCGAGNRLSLYSDGDFTIWPIPVAKEDDLPGEWEYKGCIFDNNNPYVLEWLWEDTASYSTSSMTIDICLKRCQKFGYSAGGVEYGRQCVCGDLLAVESRGEDVQKADSFCSMPCPGDRNYTCGAGNHINYYEWTGEPLNTFHYASGNEAGEYDHFSTAPLVPLISSVGINDKVVFVEKHGTSLDNTEGSFEFDYSTNTYRELALKTDVFCSASFTLPDKAGRMINIGGWSAESVYGIRFFTPDSPQGVDNGTNVWEEDYTILKLFDPRWYPTAIVLSNGSLLAMGGESGSDAPIVPTCEVLPHPEGVTESTYLDYLARADEIDRRNSYPYLAILPSSGDIFFAQFNESRIISQHTFQSIQKLPDMPGQVDNPLTGRNYPLQGTMMLMPQKAPYTDPLEILICGGTTHEPGNEALDNCVFMTPEVPGAEWTIERMPSKRVMPTMIALPDGRYLIVNGAHVGRGGFGLADDPNLNAVMYDPEQPFGSRMTVLANTTIARLYHSEGVLLSDAKVLISGSDPQDNGKHPQEKRLEYFIPDYLLSGNPQPEFTVEDRDWAYGESYEFTLTSTLTAGASNLRVSLMASIGSTHGVTMGQRTLFPAFSCDGNTCTVEAPPNAFVSPPSWYQMFVLDGPTPSHAIWVRIGGDPGRLGDWPQLPGFTTPGV